MWIKKLHRQHASVVMIIPKGALRAMKLSAGDYLQIGFKPKDKLLVMTKVENETEERNEGGRNIDQRDRGRRPSASSNR